MRLLKRDMPSKHIIPIFGDRHYGASTRVQGVESAYRARCNRSKDVHFAVDMGDVAEAITIDDRRYKAEEHEGWTPLLQYKDARQEFKQIDDLGLILSGNHDENRRILSHGNFIRDYLCDPEDGLKGWNDEPIIYGTYSAKLRIHVPDDDLSYKIFLWHGSGRPPQSNAKDPTQRRANIRASIIRKLAQQHSDCLINCVGHYHQVHSYRAPPETVLYDDGEDMHVERGTDRLTDVREYQDVKHIDRYRRWYGVTGTAKRTRVAFGEHDEGAYSPWAETKGYAPSDLGWIEVHYDHGTLWMESVFWDGSVTRIKPTGA